MNAVLHEHIRDRMYREFGSDAGEEFFRRGLGLIEARGEAINRFGRYSPSVGDLFGPFDPECGTPRATVLAADRPPVIVPNKFAAIGTREWAAGLLKEFGRERGARYVSRSLSYDQAADEFVAEMKALRGAAAAPSAVVKKEPAGFAGRVRFAGCRVQLVGSKSRT